MSVELSDNRKRVAMLVQYIGTHFYGWQKQKQGRTVQGEIEATLTKVLGRDTRIHGAG